MKKNNKKGFTLVELVIVVAVMAVLVAVAIPTVGSITGKAKEAVAESNAKTIESIIKLEEAELTETASDLDATTIATAIYEAKLGISAANASDVYAKFYYVPATGKVLTAATTATQPTDSWTITFGTATATGDISVTATLGTDTDTIDSTDFSGT